MTYASTCSVKRIGPAFAAGLLAVTASASASAAVVPGEVLVQTGQEYLGQPNVLVTGVDRPWVTGNQVGFMFEIGGFRVWSGDQGIFDNNQPVGKDMIYLLGFDYETRMGVSGPDGFVISPLINPPGGADPLDSVLSHVDFLAIEGDPAPALPLGNIVSASSPSMDANGAAYWISGVDDNGDGTTDGQVFYHAAGADPANTEVLLASGDDVFVPSGILFIQYPIAPTGILGGYAVSEDGTHRMHPLRVEGPPTSSDNVVWIDGDVVYQEGTPAAQGGNWTSFSHFAINDSGNFLLTGNTDAGTASDEVLVYNGAVALTEGATLEGVTLSSALVGPVSLNDWNQAAHMWWAGGTHSLFFACNASDLAGTSQLVAQAGDGFDTDGDGVQDATILAFDTQRADGLSEDYAIYSYVAMDTDPVTLAMVRFDVTCCGNALSDPLEECDDANADDTDACLSSCVAATCGDGFVWAGMEECDDANADDTDDCLGTCVAATCGDGIVWAGMEECDDGDAADDDACLSTCVAATCGDGAVQGGVEECDDGNRVDDDACANDCTMTAAGTDGTDTGGSDAAETSVDDTSTPDGTGTPGGTGTGDTLDGTGTPDGGGTIDPTATGDTDGPSTDGAGAGAGADEGSCACATSRRDTPVGVSLLVLAGLLGRRRRGARR